MDPSIMKLLEEDEDETMHSGADVEAFTAALNRDIEGDASTSQPSDSDSALSQGSNHNPSQLFAQWQTSSRDENANYQSQQDLKVSQQQDQLLSGMELKQHGSASENQQQQLESSTEFNRPPLQQKQSENDCQQQQAKQETLHFSQTMNMQNSEKNPIHTLEQDRTRIPGSEPQQQQLQSINQQTIATEQTVNPMNRGKQVPFALLLPVIQPQLDKDKAMQLQTLYIRLKKNEISKDGFVRLMRGLVGDQMLKMAVYKLQSQATRNLQAGPNQFAAQSQASMQQQHHMKMPSTSATQSFPQIHQKGVGLPADSSHIPSSALQVKTESSNASMDNSAQRSRELDHESDLRGMQVNQMSTSSLIGNHERERPALPMQGLSKQQQQHLHFSQSTFPIHGSTGAAYHPFSGTNASSSGTSLKPHSHDSQTMQVPFHQSMGATQSGSVTQSINSMNVPKFDSQNSITEPKRLQGGTLSHLANNSTLQQNLIHSQPSTEQKNSAPSPMFVKQEPFDQGNAVPRTSNEETFEMQSSRMSFPTSSGMVPSNSVSTSLTTQLDPINSLSSRIPSATSSAVPGANAKTPPKKPSIGQKKPLDVVGSSPSLPSKKQKVSGAFLDQSIEQLNDVTAVSGVDLREEEEQLFSGPKEDSRVSEASRKVVQEEEEKLILQKIPLQKKLAEIMVKCGLKGVSNDVERCLSLCVEERMRGVISNLVRLSKQRVDIEKPRHRTLVTSDVRQQIMNINQKAREEWEKRQAEAEKLQRLNDPEGNSGIDGDKDKDEGRMKSMKGNKEEDDKMRATAANVAARAAVGGDDMLSKWQLMAEQARQKREGGNDAASGSQPGKDVSRTPLSTSGRNRKENQEAEKRGYQAAAETSGMMSRRFGRNQVAPQTRVVRSISIKDVIAVLEREPQMSKSTMIYKLYDKMRSNASAE